MKRIIIILLVSVRALRRNVLRTLLTMLGIIIGVAAVIATVSIGTGARIMMEQQTASLGVNVVQVGAGSGFRGGVFSGAGAVTTLTTEDAQAIRREIDGVNFVSPEVQGFAQLASGSSNWNCQIIGVSEEYPQLRAWPLVDGSFFGEPEVLSAARVAIIGQTTAKQLFAGQSPVGQSLRIRDVPFTVIGLLGAKGTNMFGQDQDDTVIIPYTTAMRRVLGQTSLRRISVSAASPKVMDRVVEDITGLLRQRHRIAPGRDDDFFVRTQQEFTDLLTQTTKTMTFMLGSVAAVSLFVGGIGIMNIMLVSVTERTREIGIRIAVGAKRRNVLAQFLAESVLVSSVGGILGIATGISASSLIAMLGNWPTVTPTFWIVVAFSGSAAFGILFGFYPALKASGLDPIEALRYE